MALTYFHSMVGATGSCPNGVMSYHLVIGCPTNDKHSQYHFELTRFAISALSTRE